MDTDERWLQQTPPGEYVATAWIPGNLLNEGTAIVEAAICSLDFPKLEHHAAVYEALSSRCSTRARATPRAAGSAVSGAASSGRCSTGPSSRPTRSERWRREVETPCPVTERPAATTVSVVVSTYDWPEALDAVLRGLAGQSDIVVRGGGRGRRVRGRNRGDGCELETRASESASSMPGSQTKDFVSHVCEISGRRRPRKLSRLRRRRLHSASSLRRRDPPRVDPGLVPGWHPTRAQRTTIARGAARQKRHRELERGHVARSGSRRHPRLATSHAA